MGTVEQFKRKPSIAQLECSACGAMADASCNCGAPYVPAGQRAAEAIAKNPGKSDRAIAADIGVNRETVGKARKQLAGSQSVSKRVGRDGKTRRMPVRKTTPADDVRKQINAFHGKLVGFLMDFKEEFNIWWKTNPEITEDGKDCLMEACYLLSDGIAKLAQQIDGR